MERPLRVGRHIRALRLSAVLAIGAFFASALIWTSGRSDDYGHRKRRRRRSSTECSNSNSRSIYRHCADGCFRPCRLLYGTKFIAGKL